MIFAQICDFLRGKFFSRDIKLKKTTYPNPSSAKKTGQTISCLTVHKTPPLNSKRISDLCRIFANHFSPWAKIFALIFAREQRCGQRSVFELHSGQRWAFPVWGIYVLYTPKRDAPFLPLAK